LLVILGKNTLTMHGPMNVKFTQNGVRPGEGDVLVINAWNRMFCYVAATVSTNVRENSPIVNPQFFLDTRIGEACAKIDHAVLRSA